MAAPANDSFVVRLGGGAAEGKEKLMRISSICFLDKEINHCAVFSMKFCLFQYLLVPVAKEIHVYARENWQLEDKISHADITGVGTNITGTSLVIQLYDGLVTFIQHYSLLLSSVFV